LETYFHLRPFESPSPIELDFARSWISKRWEVVMYYLFCSKTNW
jgi:hypothetical protein